MKSTAITKMFKKVDRLFLRPIVRDGAVLIAISDGHRLLLVPEFALPAEYATALLAFKGGATRYAKNDNWKSTDINIEQVLPKDGEPEVTFKVTDDLKHTFGAKRMAPARILAAEVNDKTFTIHVSETYLLDFNEVGGGQLKFTAAPGPDGEFMGSVRVYSGDNLLGVVMPMRK